MNVFPSLEQVKDYASKNEYDIVPISMEILSDFITPIEAMRILQNISVHCFMLESAMAQEHWGRYTFMGYDLSLIHI